MGSVFIIQSSVKDPEYLLQRCRAFLQDVARPMIHDVTAEKFIEQAKAINVAREEVDSSLTKLFNRLFREIETHQYKFQRKEEEKAIIDSWIALDDNSEMRQKVKDVFDNTFLQNRQMATVAFTCSGHQSERDENEPKTKEAYTGDVT